MITQFNHQAVSSFKLWTESVLVSDRAKAYYTNQPNQFTYVNFPDIPSGSFVAYQGQYRQLVADHDIDVPNSGIFIDGNFVSGDEAGIYMDYVNGRVIMPAASGDSLTITANNTVKEINVYMVEEDEEKLLITSDFIDAANPTGTHLSSQPELLDDKTFLLPAVFLRQETSNNLPFSFGGEVDTRLNMRMVVLAFDNYMVDGVLSLFWDKDKSCIKLIPFEDDPYGRSNTLKSFPYSYSSLAANYTDNMFIESVRTSRVTDSLSLEKLQKNLIMGFVDFDLSIYRYPNA